MKGGAQIDLPPSEKTTLKKPSLIRVNVCQYFLNLHLHIHCKEFHILSQEKNFSTKRPTVFFQTHLRYAFGWLLSKIEKQFWILLHLQNNNFSFQCKISHFPYFQYSLNICYSCVKAFFLSQFFAVRAVSTYIFNVSLFRSTQHIPQTATLTPFRTPIPVISHFDKFEFNSENKLLNTSICSFSMLALCKLIKIYQE